MRLLHRDRFVDVDRAADLEDGAALREVDRRVEAQSIYAKIGVSTRAGATLFAIEHGLLRDNSL